jgi:catechol 2,3-dioxygenase-like lactoylglutathione lyase family enzyme
MIKQIAHICLTSKDLDASLKYYIGALGLDKHFEFIRDGKIFGFYLKAGEGTFIEIFQGETQPPPGNAPIRHLCLEVDDIDQAIKRLRDAGYECGDKKLGADHSWQAWTKDPDGVAIEFHQYTEASCQYSKKPCVL